MGFRISLLAARVPKADLLRQLDLIDSDVIDDANEAAFSAADLSNGWSIVWADDAEWADTSRLSAITDMVPVVACMVDETIMASSIGVAGPDGHWSMTYGFEEEGVLDGEAPATFTPLIEATKRLQAEEDGVDHLFDVPVRIAETLMGYRYDTFRYEWGEPQFTIATPSGDR